MNAATFKPEYLLPGTLIGSYRVCSHLGSGSGAVVYDVESLEGNHHALKVSRFRPGVHGSMPWIMDQRFSRCILCLLQLRSCQNVAQILAHDRYPDPRDGWQYLVQERVPGGEVITDWVWRSAPPSCVSPELALAMLKERFDGREEPFLFLPTGDLHALGCLLYEVLTGEHPFDITEDDPRRQLEEIAHRKPVFPHHLNEAIPFPVTKVVMRLLQKDPAKRYQHGLEVAKDLQLLLDKMGTDESWQRPFLVPLGEDAPDPSVLSPAVASPKAEGVQAPSPRPRQPSAPAPAPAELAQEAPAQQPAAPPRKARLWRPVAVAAMVLCVGLVIAKEGGLVDRVVKLTALAGCAVFGSCAGIKVRVDDMDWLASCSPEARRTATEELSNDIKPPHFSFDDPVFLQAGENVILQEPGVEIRQGPVVGAALIILPVRKAYLHGTAKTGADGVSIRFDKLVKDGRELPICALGGLPGHWPGLDIADRSDPEAPPASKLHPGFILSYSRQLEVRVATESWPPAPKR